MTIVRHYELPEDDGLEADEALWFANSRRAALDTAEDAHRRARQIDRLVNWGFTALILAVGAWAVFA